MDNDPRRIKPYRLDMKEVTELGYEAVAERL
jgi:hypothetical protein